MKSIALIFTFFVICQLSAQQIELNQPVTIDESGSFGDSSAILDIQSTTKGLLIPRMDSMQRKNIANPAEGLLVYDLNTFGFWYFQNSLC